MLESSSAGTLAGARVERHCTSDTRKPCAWRSACTAPTLPFEGASARFPVKSAIDRTSNGLHQSPHRYHGLFLAEGSSWRRQRRMLSPVFTPHNVGALLPHFSAAVDGLVAALERAPVADLSAAFQDATLEAVLRALFSMPDSEQRAKIGVMVRSYITGPGRPNILDALARTVAAYRVSSRASRSL